MWKWYIGLVVASGLFAGTIDRDLVVPNSDVTNFISVVSKVTGKNIIVTDKLDFKVSAMVEAGSDDDVLIDVLREMLDIRQYDLVVWKDGYKVLAKNAEAKVLYTSGDVERMGDILTQRAFLVKQGSGRSVFVNGDEKSQSLTVVGVKADIVALESVFEQSRLDGKKVVLEAKIVELSSEDISKFGVETGLIQAGENSGDVIRKLATQAITENVLKFAPTVGGGSAASALSASLNFLSTNGSVLIQEEPSIEVLSGHESELYSGSTIYVQDRVDKNGQASYTKTDVGLRLTVKPFISKDSTIDLDITILAENRVGMDTNGKPVIVKKKLHTTTTLLNKQSVILGSLTKQNMKESEGGVPWLKDLPVVGWVFGNTGNEESSKSMLIIIKAYIVEKGDIEGVREDIAKDKRYEALYKSMLYNKFARKEEVEVSKEEESKHEEQHNVINDLLGVDY